MGVSIEAMRCAVERTPLAVLSDAEMALLGGSSFERSFHERKGDIWSRPECSDALLIVTKGRFRVARSVPARGRRSEHTVLFRMAGKGELLGVSRLVGEPRAAAVIAQGRASAIACDAGVVRSFMDSNSRLAIELLRWTRRLVAGLVSEVVALRADLFVDRLVGRIEQELSSNAGHLRLTQKELAQMVGGTAPDVARATKAFSAVMRWERGVLVVDNLEEARRLLALRDAVAEDPDLSG